MNAGDAYGDLASLCATIGPMRLVTVFTHGGLGNQLFQLAAGHSLGDVRQILSYSGGWGAGHPTLADFGVSVVYPNRLLRTTVPGIAMKESWKDDVSARAARAVGRLRGITVVNQEHPFAEREELTGTGALVLNGYFQHPTWWVNSWRGVAEMIAEQAPGVVREGTKSGPAVIKIRRSDYLGLGWALSEEWLSRAIEALDIAGNDVHLLAEDEETRGFAMPVVRDHGCQVHDAPHLVDDPHMNDFWTIAQGRIIISANSSFSWWASAVAEVLHGATVAYPTPWLPNTWSKEELPDMGLPGWLAVSEPHFALRASGGSAGTSC